MAQAAASDTAPLRTIVGIFSTDRKAVEAMRSLDAAGFDPDWVQMTGDDPSRAAEIGGKTFAIAGSIVGLIIGAVVVAGLAVWGDLATDPVGLVVGAIGVVGGMTAIGFVVGRTMGRHAPDAQFFARVVQNGGAIVAVQCVEGECDLAARVLDGAGAREVRDEVGPGAI